MLDQPRTYPVNESLFLRELQLSDSDFIIELLNDADWKRFIGEFGVTTIDAAHEYLKSRILPSYETNGYGLFAIEQRNENSLIGMCGLVNRPQLSNPDLGFALLPEYRRQGIVKATSETVMQLAVSHWAIQTLDAITNPDNNASIQLLKSLGFYEQEQIILQTESPPVLLLRTELKQGD